MKNEVNDSKAVTREAYLVHSLPFLILPVAVFLSLEHSGLLEKMGLPAMKATAIYIFCPGLWFFDVISNWKGGTDSIYGKTSPWVLAASCCIAYFAFYGFMVFFHKYW